MKKKTMALLLAISCVLSATACGATEAEEAKELPEAGAELQEELHEEEPEEVEEPEAEEETEIEEEPEAKEAPEAEEEPEKEENKPAAAGALSDNLYDFQLSIDGTVYQFPMFYADFEALGWAYDGDPTNTLSANQYTSVEVWKKDGFRVYTRFANLSMNAVPYSESMVAGITLDQYNLKDCDWEIILPGGIQYGVADADAIRKAYGEPTSDHDSDLRYSMTYQYDFYREIKLSVDKEKNALSEVKLLNLVEMEGVDNSINEEVPELVKAYQAPESLGDDFYAYTVEMEGVVYSLPCPVSVLVENGFTINTEGSDSEVAAGGVGWVDLTYNNQTLHTMVKNYADYATIVENCFAVSMKSSVNGPKFDLVFPGGIKVGDSEDAVKKATAKFNCETETSDSGFTYYEVFDPDGSSLDCYSIVVKDGSVCTIEIENSKEPKY